MKLKLSELKPNEFKKHINGGKLNLEQVEKIKSNLKELGLMGAIPVYKKGEHYHIIAGHHRVEALKQTFGKDYQVEVVIHKYSPDQVLRGMVVENLSQRKGEFQEEKENLLLIREYLRKQFRSLSERNPKGGRPDESGSVRDISNWLNKQGEVMSVGKISNLLSIADKLSPELQERVQKASTTAIDNQDEGVIPVNLARELAKVESHEHQEALAEILTNTDEFRDEVERSKAITTFKSLSEEEKEEVLSGERDLKTTKDVEGMGSGEMALTFNRRANELVLEMRSLRKTLYQFRRERLFDQFSPNQRQSFFSRLSSVKKEYGELVAELEASMEVLQDE